jgi:hypothetical protein
LWNTVVLTIWQWRTIKSLSVTGIYPRSWKDWNIVWLKYLRYIRINVGINNWLRRTLKLIPHPQWCLAIGEEHLHTSINKEPACEHNHVPNEHIADEFFGVLHRMPIPARHHELETSVDDDNRSNSPQNHHEPANHIINQIHHMTGLAGWLTSAATRYEPRRQRHQWNERQEPNNQRRRNSRHIYVPLAYHTTPFENSRKMW